MPAQNPAAPLPRNRANPEFEIEGRLEIVIGSSGLGSFLIDDTYLSEFVQRHFGVARDGKNVIDLGPCKILIIPVRE